MKRVSVLLLALLVMVFSLATLDAAGPVKTLTVWAMGEEGVKLPEMAKQFEAGNPGIKVEIQSIPWGNAHDKIATAIAAGSGPDLSQMGTTWMAEFASAGGFEQIDKYLATSKALKKSDFFSGSFNSNIYRGKLYGIPWYVETRAIFYRTDLLGQVGFKNGPQTWEELAEATKKLTGNGKYGITLENNNWQALLPFVWQNGGRLFDNKGKVTVTEAAFVEALKYYVSFFKDKVAPIDTQGTNLLQEFASGRFPMYISGPWMVHMTLEQVPDINGKWAVAMMPKKKTRTSFVGGCNLVMFKSSKNKKEAWKFMEFMSKAQNQVEWAKISTDLPSNKAAWNDSYFTTQPHMKVFAQQLEDAQSPDVIPQWEQVGNIINRYLQEACYEKITPEQAAQAMAKDIKAIL